MITPVRQLDVRTKLLLVVLANVLVINGMKDASLLLKETLFISLFIILMLIRKRFKAAIIYSLLFLLLVTVSYLGQQPSSGPMLTRLAAFFWGGVRFYPGVMAGAYLIHSSSASMLFQACDQLRLPRQLSIPFVVTLRFIPHFAQEFKTVMKMFRLRRSTFSWPQRLRLDNYVLPLLNTAIKSAEDLSKAAYARGLSVTNQRTYYQKNKPTFLDGLLLLVALGIIIY